MNSVSRGFKRKLILAATAVLLTIVTAIFGYGYFRTEVVVKKLYEESLNCQNRGDEEKAKLKLTEIIRIDSSYRDAKERLALLRRSGVDKQHDLQNKSNEKSGFNSVASTEIMPGYRLANSSSSADEDVRDYIISAKESLLTEATITTKRYQSQRDADNAIASLRNKYSRNQQAIWINGRMVYYGNDGKKTSLLAWEENAEIVVIIGIASKGPPGASLDSMKILARGGS